MRVLVVLCLLAVLVAVLVTASFTDLWSRAAGADPPPGAVTASRGSSTVEVLAPGTVATRALAESASSEGIADQPTACLQVFDYATKRPLAGAAVRRVQGGAEVAFTDERGFAGVPLKDREQLAVVLDDYLLRLVPTQLGSTEAEPQLVQLVRDAWSWRRRLHFVGPDGPLATAAFVRFRPREGSGPVSSPVPPGDAVLQRAWSEHTMLAGLPVCRDVAVQVGVYSADRVHRLADAAEVRFVAPGDFTVEVATTTGLVARADLRVDGAPGASADVRLDLVPGTFVGGTVVAASTSAPLAGAELTVQGGDPLGLLATTAADGTFRIGPLLSVPVTLHVRHGDHEPFAFGPVQPPADGVRIELQPLPASTLRGRVRARPGLQPLASATIVWSPSAGAPVTARAAADGTFLLRATGATASRLTVQAPGYQSLAELVSPGSPFADYDLWPATTAGRLDAHLSAMLQGIVVDARGLPLPNVAVRWNPARRSPDAGVPGRRVLDGGSLDLPLVTMTLPDGSFALETNCCGQGFLSLSQPEAGSTTLTIDVVPGTTTNGLRLQR
ncbi:MAG TPA: hypothetical protein VFZ65_02120 [Planctomycetota bacterium]|nr:hypothetical protein [Planctomycetota bacterium]